MDLLNPREPINTWSHGLWLMIALAGIIVLWQRGHGDRAKQVSLLIYGLSLIFCSACSTLYHGVRLPGERIKAFALLDHVGIYILIAGTYTPIAWTFLRRHWRRGVLGLVWSWAALGITIRLTYETLPPWLYTGFYLGMGWGALFCYFEVARRLSHRAMIPIVAGGVLYSLGAIFNLLHEPVLWPGVFQAHRALPPVRRGRKHVPLLLHAHGGGAVRARFATVTAARGQPTLTLHVHRPAGGGPDWRLTPTRGSWRYTPRGSSSAHTQALNRLAHAVSSELSSSISQGVTSSARTFRN